MEWENMTNSHIRKSLTKKSNGTRNLFHGNFNIPPLQFLFISGKLKPITMKSLSALENPTPLPSAESQFITFQTLEANPRNKT